jgi:GT2 family glycosyltransferase
MSSEEIKLAPIVLFAYNRPVHLQKVLDALSQNEESKSSVLYIYCDGPKSASNEIDQNNLDLVYNICVNENRFREKFIIRNAQNKGLANSVINGVTDILKKYQKIIVLEDDIMPSVGFLNYMNSALNLYSEEDQVGCIHAWNYELNYSNFDQSTFFLKGADCWGWGTWSRAWDLFNPNAKELLDIVSTKKIEFQVNRNGTYPFVDMLRQQIDGKVDSWAIRWYVSLFLENKYCLHPTRPIVKNIGFDNSGVHCGELDLFQEPVDFINISKIPIEESHWFLEAYQKNEKNKNKKTINSIIKSIIVRLKKIFNII